MRIIVLVLIFGTVAAVGVLAVADFGAPERKTSFLGGDAARGGAAEAREAAGPSEPDPGTASQPAAPAARFDVAPEPGEIRGVVRDRGGDVAVTHAEVTARLYTPPGERNYALVPSFTESVEVDEHGHFSVIVPGGGWYRLTAEAEGFAPATLDELQPGTEVTFELDLGSTLKGRVVVEGEDTPIAGVSVVGRTEDGIVRKAKTGKDGDFLLSDLPAGVLRLDLKHEEFVHRLRVEQEIAVASKHEVLLALDPGKSVKGRVLTKLDHFAVPEASVTVGDKEVVTDEGGRFVVRGVPAEPLSVRVTAVGFLPHDRSVNLAGSREEAEVEVELEEGAEIYGEVTTFDGSPVVDATVKLFIAYGSSWMQEDWQSRHLAAKTDDQGRYSLHGIRPRKWAKFAVGARHGDHPYTFVRDVRVKRPDDRVRIDVVMRTGGVVQGWVVDQAGSSVEGARVVLQSSSAYEYSSGGRSLRMVAGTDEKGTFTFTSVAEGKYWLTVEARGYSTAWKGNIEIVGPSERRDLEIELEKGEPLRGVVKDKQGIALAGAAVTVQAKRAHGKAVSGDEGGFVIPSIPKGPYRVTAKLKGYARFYKRKMSLAGDELVIEMAKQPYISGRVVDADTGKPVENCRTYLMQEDKRRKRWRRKAYDRVTASDKGRFTLQADAGTYRLKILARGYVKHVQEDVELSLEGESPPVDVRLERGGAIEGYVRGADGRPIAGANVYHRRQDGGPKYFRERTHSERDGYFFLGDLDAGDHEVVVKKHGYPVKHADGIIVGGDRPAQIDFDLESFASLTLFTKWDKRPGEGRRRLITLPDGRTYFRRSRRVRASVTIENLERTPFAMRYKDWSSGEGSRYALDTRQTLRMNNGRRKVLKDVLPGLYRITTKVKGYEAKTEYRRLDYGTKAYADFVFEREPEPGETPAATTGSRPASGLRR